VNAAASASLAVAALLLVAAGFSKTVRPDTTARALRVAPAAVRAGACAEAVLGILALLSVGGRITSALVATSYLAFASFVTVALVQDRPLATCGCFGEPDTPPTLVHVLIDAALAAGCAHAAATATPVPHGWALAAAAVPAYMAFVAMTALPRALTAGRR
jgi:methylamine utilization protein MauE